MKITSRLRFSPPAIAHGISVIASSPGPPASQTIGSGFGIGAFEGVIVTDRLIVLPFGWARSSGATSRPQLAVFSSGVGPGGFAQGPGVKVEAGPVPGASPAGPLAATVAGPAPTAPGARTT